MSALHDVHAVEIEGNLKRRDPGAVESLLELLAALRSEQNDTPPVAIRLGRGGSGLKRSAAYIVNGARPAGHAPLNRCVLRHQGTKSVQVLIFECLSHVNRQAFKLP